MSQTASFLMSMSGVNIGEFLDDTSELSTIRGGGLLLLNAVDMLKAEFPELGEPVSCGASDGLFLLEDMTHPDALALRDKVDDWLSHHRNLKHATFVVDVEAMKEGEDFRRARETLMARNRWRQMRSPSLAIPRPTGLPACESNAVRPRESGGKKVCASVAVRQDYGKEQKQKFYADLTKLKDLPTFAREFSDIASDRSRGNLHNKLAVVYLDGNAFGNIHRDATTPAELHAFDEYLRGKRRKFMTDLLEEIRGDSNWLNPAAKDGPVLRFETLLWGGDELMFVVPAWQGWALLQKFFKASESWIFSNKKVRLHHGAGLVFCHHNAPIAQIRRLAHDLAEHVKEALEDKTKESGLAYLALESFDSVGADLSSYLEESLLKYPGKDKAKLWWLPAKVMKDWAVGLPRIADGLPKRRVYRAARQVAETGDYDRETLLTGLDKSTLEVWDTLENLLGSGLMSEQHADAKAQMCKLLPLHLVLLWDYLDTQTQGDVS